jgi:tRNA pseudouridine13 synthase
VKLRQKPEDFSVEEECALQPAPSGPHGLYRLWKRGLTTPEAVSRVARAAGVRPSRVAFCGLKDRHAVAVQTVTIAGPTVGGVRGEGFMLAPLGRCDRRASAKEIIGNRFAIRVRDLSDGEAQSLIARAKDYAAVGVPNYFDEQRFGSARSTGVFPGELVLRGDASGALRIVIATCSREDPAAVKRRRRMIADLWGDWRQVSARLGPSMERSAVAHLAAKPGDFAGAFERLPGPLRDMAMSAFQSFLWNEVLSRLVRSRAGSAGAWTHRGRYGEIVFAEPEAGDMGGLAKLVIPFPHKSARPSDPDAARTLDEVLAARGLTREAFRLKGYRATRFRKGGRRAFMEVRGLAVEGPIADDLNAGRKAVVLSFGLPAGSYATIFLKAALRQEEYGGRHARFASSL